MTARRQAALASGSSTRTVGVPCIMRVAKRYGRCAASAGIRPATRPALDSVPGSGRQTSAWGSDPAVTAVTAGAGGAAAVTFARRSSHF